MINLQQITIQPFPTSSTHETCLMEVSGRFFEIGKDVVHLIIYLQQNGCGKENIAAYVRETGKYTEEEVCGFLEMLSKKVDDDQVVSDKKKVFLTIGTCFRWIIYFA